MFDFLCPITLVSELSAFNTFVPSSLSTPNEASDCSSKSIAMPTLINALSRDPILGSGVDIGAAIGAVSSPDMMVSVSVIETSFVGSGVAFSGLSIIFNNSCEGCSIPKSLSLINNFYHTTENDKQNK